MIKGINKYNIFYAVKIYYILYFLKNFAIANLFLLWNFAS